MANQEDANLESAANAAPAGPSVLHSLDGPPPYGPEFHRRVGQTRPYVALGPSASAVLALLDSQTQAPSVDLGLPDDHTSAVAPVAPTPPPLLPAVSPAVVAQAVTPLVTAPAVSTGADGSTGTGGATTFDPSVLVDLMRTQNALFQQFALLLPGLVAAQSNAYPGAAPPTPLDVPPGSGLPAPVPQPVVATINDGLDRVAQTLRERLPPRREEKLPPHVLKILDTVRPKYEQRVRDFVKAVKTRDKASEDLDLMINDESFARYPPNTKPFASCPTDKFLDDTLSICNNGEEVRDPLSFIRGSGSTAVPVRFTLPPNCKRREALRLAHWHYTRFVKFVYAENTNAHRDAKQADAERRALLPMVQSLIDEAGNPEACARMGLENPATAPVDQAILQSKVDNMYTTTMRKIDAEIEKERLKHEKEATKKRREEEQRLLRDPVVQLGTYVNDAARAAVADITFPHAAEPGVAGNGDGDADGDAPMEPPPAPRIEAAAPDAAAAVRALTSRRRPATKPGNGQPPRGASGQNSTGGPARSDAAPQGKGKGKGKDGKGKGKAKGKDNAQPVRSPIPAVTPTIRPHLHPVAKRTARPDLGTNPPRQRQIGARGGGRRGTSKPPPAANAAARRTGNAVGSRGS